MFVLENILRSVSSITGSSLSITYEVLEYTFPQLLERVVSNNNHIIQYLCSVLSLKQLKVL